MDAVVAKQQSTDSDQDTGESVRTSKRPTRFEWLFSWLGFSKMYNIPICKSRTQ